MPRRPRIATAGIVFHVLNRRVGRRTLFQSDRDYRAFEKVLEEAVAHSGIRLLSYCLMPNHWHLLMWPNRDDQLSETMRWLTVTHTQRHHAHHRTAGTGPLYQGRFKSFPVEGDEHFLTVARYVERNALQANLVARAEDWPWCSLWRRRRGSARQPTLLSEWPTPQPRNWTKYVNGVQTPKELEKLRTAVRRGSPFGNPSWQSEMAKRLSLESTLRPRGRPRKRNQPE